MFAQAHKFNYLVIFILVLIKTPMLCWGFSFERTQSYLQSAEIRKLAENLQWIKLGHFKKTWLGYRSGFQTGFFISENGFQSPADELVATIKLLYSESTDFIRIHKMHPQCFYLARTQWLNQQLNVTYEDRVECVERDQWKKRLNTTSVSLIFASGDIGNAASIFGHTFLKLNNPNNHLKKELLDYGIDYSADADASDGFLYAVKGLFGFYDGHFAMLPFHQKILDYTNIEGRDLWEFRLNFSQEEVKFLINHLLEMENAQAPYYFSNDNCSTQILRTLEVVRPGLNLADSIKNFVVPIDTVKLIENHGQMVSDVYFRPSLKTKFLNSFKNLDSDQRNYFPTLIKNLNFESTQISFSDLQKAQLLDAATAALAVESFKNGTNLDEKKYQLYLKRVELGPGRPSESVSRPLSPTKTHDSAAVSFGLLKNGYMIKWRSTFHELELPHEGLIPHSHIEAISFSAKYSAVLKKMFFDRFTLLQIINLNPSNSLENNLAWKARVEIQDQFRPDLEAGVGASFSLTRSDSFRWTSFLTARHWYSNDQLTGVGPEVLISYHPWNQLGLSLSATHFLIASHDDFLRYKSAVNWQFAKDFGLKFLYENFIEKKSITDSKEEIRAELAYNFIF
jgi:hypothetical protein